MAGTMPGHDGSTFFVTTGLDPVVHGKKLTNSERSKSATGAKDIREAISRPASLRAEFVLAFDSAIRLMHFLSS
jgi:hypothetical protein